MAYMQAGGDPSDSQWGRSM